VWLAAQTGQQQEKGLAAQTHPLPLILSPFIHLSPHHPHKGVWMLFDWVCCVVERGLEKESHFPFAVLLPPARWSQCTLFVPSYDQLATAGQINTPNPPASMTPI